MFYSKSTAIPFSSDSRAASIRRRIQQSLFDFHDLFSFSHYHVAQVGVQLVAGHTPVGAGAARPQNRNCGEPWSWKGLLHQELGVASVGCPSCACNHWASGQRSRASPVMHRQCLWSPHRYQWGRVMKPGTVPTSILVAVSAAFQTDHIHDVQPCIQTSSLVTWASSWRRSFLDLLRRL